MENWNIAPKHRTRRRTRQPPAKVFLYIEFGHEGNNRLSTNQKLTFAWICTLINCQTLPWNAPHFTAIFTWLFHYANWWRIWTNAIYATVFSVSTTQNTLFATNRSLRVLWPQLINYNRFDETFSLFKLFTILYPQITYFFYRLKCKRRVQCFFSFIFFPSSVV